MLFNSLVFLFLFLPVTYVVFWGLRTAGARFVWLAATGYIFYGYWDPRFCLLMAASTIISYVAGLGFLRFTGPWSRRLCLVIPITVDLGLLGFFKYTNFLVESFQGLSQWLGFDVDAPALNIILPVGISFYTFHTITYIVDSYRGTIRPTRNLFEFAAYVSLFSQLVAGPIVRFRQIEQDLENLGSTDRTRWLARGAAFFAIGLVEKVIVADGLAAFVDPMLAQFESLSTAATWLAMSGYSFQLYFDFCGYSDMAVGLGYLFGLRIPLNFNSPYKAVDPSDFWRRWHISLSTCLRDYLYIPMGGSRQGQGRTFQNLMLTMLIGGLWHGANWTFVVWGAYHGGLLVLYRRFGHLWDRLPQAARQVAMFVLVLIGWVFFRSTDFRMALSLLEVMFVPTSGTGIELSGWFLTILGIAAWWGLIGPNAHDLQARARWRPGFALMLSAVYGACVAVIAGSTDSPFLYFQF